MSTFNVNDKVVCLVEQSDWKWTNEWLVIGELPKKGKIYVVEQVQIAGPKEGLVLVGNYVIRRSEGVTVGFDSIHFRKLEGIKREARELNESLNEARKLINLY